jgi:hypothetical protein
VTPSKTAKMAAAIMAAYRKEWENEPRQQDIKCLALALREMAVCTQSCLGLSPVEIYDIANALEAQS